VRLGAKRGKAGVRVRRAARRREVVHIASALNVSLSRNREEGSDMELDPAYELFAKGFTHKPGQDYVSLASTRCGSALRRPWATATSSACGASPPLLAALRLLTRSSRSSWPSASAVGNPEREDSPAYLLKRLFEQENAALRQKKRRDAAAELKDLVTSSSTSCARQTFRRSVPRHSSGSAR
jgi:hypothetical protein